MEKKVGLFIKTYSNNTTKNERIDIIEELFISVMNNVDSNIIKILIVDQVQNDYHKQNFTGEAVNRICAIFENLEL